MANFYSLCDVLVLPSGTECFGMVQAEAMLYGTPVVVSNTPDACEVVRVTWMGKVAPWRGTAALAETIADVLRDPDAYFKPPETIAAVFNAERTVDTYEDLFWGALKQGVRRGRT